MSWLKPLELFKEIVILLLATLAYGIRFVLGLIELLTIVLFHGPIVTLGNLALDDLLQDMDEVLDRIRW